jgi:hypothetical protein
MIAYRVKLGNDVPGSCGANRFMILHMLASSHHAGSSPGVKSALILQPGPAALTDGLDATVAALSGP